MKEAMYVVKEQSRSCGSGKAGWVEYDGEWAVSICIDRGLFSLLLFFYYSYIIYTR